MTWTLNNTWMNLKATYVMSANSYSQVIIRLSFFFLLVEGQYCVRSTTNMTSMFIIHIRLDIRMNLKIISHNLNFGEKHQSHVSGPCHFKKQKIKSRWERLAIFWIYWHFSMFLATLTDFLIHNFPLLYGNSRGK